MNAVGGAASGTERASWPQVTAVVVAHQSGHTIAATLAALRPGHEQGLLRCIVVDNASTDATRTILAAAADWATIVLVDENLGFGRACNLGFDRVATPFTLFLNPDATVGPEAICTLIGFFESQPHAGVVGPATAVGAPGSGVWQHTGPRPRPLHVLQRLSRCFGRLPPQVPILPGQEPFRTGWVCGAVLLIRTDLMRRLGGFDPRFFLYWEEMDLCHRVEQAGYQIWAVGTARAEHVCGASSAGRDDMRIDGCIARHFFPSRRHYLVKHFGWLPATSVELVEFAVLLLFTVIDVVRGRGTQRIRPRLQAPLLARP